MLHFSLKLMKDMLALHLSLSGYTLV